MHSTHSFPLNPYFGKMRTKRGISVNIFARLPHTLIILIAIIMFAAYFVSYYMSSDAEQSLKKAYRTKITLEEEAKTLRAKLDEHSSLQALAQAPAVQGLEEVQKSRYLELDKQGAVARR